MTAGNPLVSIIIPYFNHNEYLDEALNSATKQTYPNIEIILVDDGSGTPYVAKTTLGRHIKHIRQNNQGQGVARNRGAKESEGEFLAFLDSDDIWDLNKIEAQVKLLHQFPEAIAVYCDYRTIDNNGGVTQETSALGTPRPSGFILPQLLFGNCVGSPSVVMVRRRSFMQAGGFNETYSKASEDYKLWLSLASAGPFLYQCETRVSYRRHESQTSREADFYLQRALGNLDAIKSIKPLISQKRNKILQLYNERQWNAILTLNWASRKAGERKLALRACLEAFKMRPWRVDITIHLIKSLL